MYSDFLLVHHFPYQIDTETLASFLYFAEERIRNKIIDGS